MFTRCVYIQKMYTHKTMLRVEINKFGSSKTLNTFHKDHNEQSMYITECMTMIWHVHASFRMPKWQIIPVKLPRNYTGFFKSCILCHINWERKERTIHLEQQHNYIIYRTMNSEHISQWSNSWISVGIRYAVECRMTTSNYDNAYSTQLMFIQQACSADINSW